MDIREGVSGDIISLFRDMAKKVPEKVAYYFLKNGLEPSENLTYQRLDVNAERIAAYLQANQFLGKKVILIYPAGFDYVCSLYACLYTGVIAVPVECPDNHNFQKIIPHVSNIMIDAGIDAILTTTSVLKFFKEKNIAFGDISVIDTSQLKSNTEQRYEKPIILQDTLALILYTSGSTAASKGVMLSYGNLNHMIVHASKAWLYSHESVTLTWLSHVHAFGIILLTVPLFNQSTVYIMPSANFVLDNSLWLQAISKFKVTHTGAPNFAYQLCVDKLTAEQLTDVDLSSWLVAFVAGEPVRANTLVAFYEKFKEYGFQDESFYPFFGMTEFIGPLATPRKRKKPTIYTNEKEDQTFKKIVSCGELFAETAVLSVNPDTLQPLPESEIGEIWATGPSLCLGYWNPKLEKDKILPFVSMTVTGSETPQRYFRTGDLGFVKNGELFLTGRLKEVIIIRGKKYYPHDIEAAATLDIPELKNQVKAAFSYDINGKESVIFLQEVPDTLEDRTKKIIISEVRKAITKSSGIRVDIILLLRSGSLPRTSAGKLQRLRYKEYYKQDKLDVLYRDQIKKHSGKSELSSNMIKLVFENLKGIDAKDLNELDMNKSILEMGMDSISQLQLLTAINNTYHIQLTQEELFLHPSIGELINFIKKKKNCINSKEKKSHVIAMNANNDVSNLFCIHPVGGHIECYAKFAAVTKTHKIYGIEAVGFEDNSEPLKDIKVIAEKYIKEMQTIQPEGPYHILGWSMGGVVAFEMAVQLNNKGEKTILILVDSYEPTISNLKHGLDDATFIFLIDGMLSSWLQYMRISNKQIPIQRMLKLSLTKHKWLVKIANWILKIRYRNKIPNINKLSDYVALIRHDIESDKKVQLPLQDIIANAKQSGLLTKDIEDSLLLRSYEVFRSNVYALNHYKTPFYQGDIILFTSTSSSSMKFPPDLGWGTHCAFLQTYKLSCPHFSIFSNDQSLMQIQRIIETIDKR